MNTSKVNGSGRGFSIAAAWACALALLGAHCGSAWAQAHSAAARPGQTRIAADRLADLEKAFWVCDYTATEKGVSAAPVELCGAVTESLKNEKFKGDFDEMLEWWRRNKIAVHQSLRDEERLSQRASARTAR